MSANTHRPPRKLPFKPRLTGPERQARILAVALDAFAAGGYEQTSMGTIAAGADVTRAVLYRYFPSKQALYLAILEDQAARIGDYVTGQLTTGSLIERLRTAATAYLDFAEQHPQTWALLLDDTATHPECARGRRRLHDIVIGTGLATLADDITSIGQDPADPRLQLAMQFVVSGLNGAIDWRRAHPAMPIDEVIATIELLFRTIGTLPA